MCLPRVDERRSKSMEESMHPTRPSLSKPARKFWWREPRFMVKRIRRQPSRNCGPRPGEEFECEEPQKPAGNHRVLPPAGGDGRLREHEEIGQGHTGAAHFAQGSAVREGKGISREEEVRAGAQVLELR